MRECVAGIVAVASMMLLAVGGEASPSGPEALPPGFNDAVYHSAAIERPGAQFVPRSIRFFHDDSEYRFARRQPAPSRS